MVVSSIQSNCVRVSHRGREGFDCHAKWQRGNHDVGDSGALSSSPEPCWQIDNEFVQVTISNAERDLLSTVSSVESAALDLCSIGN